jgi:hypothetical protein
MKDIDKKMMKLSDKWIDRVREKDNWGESFLNNISRRKGMPAKPTDPAMRCLNALLRDVPELKDYDVEEVWHYLQWRCREACDWPGDVDWEPPECYEDPNTDLNSAEKLRDELMRPSGCSLDDGYAWLGMVTNMGRTSENEM